MEPPSRARWALRPPHTERISQHALDHRPGVWLLEQRRIGRHHDGAPFRIGDEPVANSRALRQLLGVVAAVALDDAIAAGQQLDDTAADPGQAEQAIKRTHLTLGTPSTFIPTAENIAAGAIFGATAPTFPAIATRSWISATAVWKASR